MAEPKPVLAGKSGISSNPLTTEEQRKMHAYFRAANYLSVGQIYLFANAMLREPLKISHVKPRLRVTGEPRRDLISFMSILTG
jgi:phosphoketolase